MLEILNIENFGPQTVCITPELRLKFAQILKQHCKETGNCDACADKKRGQPCPYRGNPINWRLREE